MLMECKEKEEPFCLERSPGEYCTEWKRQGLWYPWKLISTTRGGGMGFRLGEMGCGRESWSLDWEEVGVRERDR